MTPKEPSEARKFTNDDLKSDPDAVTEAARRPGGVTIHCEDGRSYHMSIPCAELECDDERCAALREENRRLKSKLCKRCGETCPDICATPISYDDIARDTEERVAGEVADHVELCGAPWAAEVADDIRAGAWRKERSDG